ncbi:hypothetical protein OUZ56_033050 [Daphnia magna]|uniref:Uncharacterized protein n=1 Tax=Daphnia magna TaxID=35525 RepID=A0ABR0BA31_9CRUS|nr:hypothetical protein OUZ56_033050 [Daphnia magna]
MTVIFELKDRKLGHDLFIQNQLQVLNIVGFIPLIHKITAIFDMKGSSFSLVGVGVTVASFPTVNLTFFFVRKQGGFFRNGQLPRSRLFTSPLLLNCCAPQLSLPASERKSQGNATEEQDRTGGGTIGMKNGK